MIRSEPRALIKLLFCPPAAATRCVQGMLNNVILWREFFCPNCLSINGLCDCEPLVFADEDGLLRELVLLPHGTGSIAEGDRVSGLAKPADSIRSAFWRRILMALAMT